MRFALTVSFTLKPGQIGVFLPLVRANARLSLANEPGCRAFDVALPDDGQADAVFLWELYDSRADFDAHLASPHFRTFNAETAAMVAAKVVHFYHVPE
jgi:(4S)-4-hydroxy-5-phosphonooxypentane-2,3-dione isomerase